MLQFIVDAIHGWYIAVYMTATERLSYGHTAAMITSTIAIIILVFAFLQAFHYVYVMSVDLFINKLQSATERKEVRELAERKKKIRVIDGGAEDEGTD